MPPGWDPIQILMAAPSLTNFTAKLNAAYVLFSDLSPTYSERKKFTRSCWFFELRALKLVTLWFASDET
jgi:hypothetical protein